jgi:DNA repair protein RadD
VTDLVTVPAAPEPPGFSWRRLLAALPASDLRGIVGGTAADLVDLVNGGSATQDTLAEVARRVADPEILLADPSSRALLFQHLPPHKLTELRERLAFNLGRNPDTIFDPARWNAATQREVLHFLGVLEDSAPASPSATRALVAPSYGLFPHQLRAARQVQGVLYNDDRRVVLHLPTGAGKTRTAMHLVADHLRAHGPTLVVWLAHGNELLTQAADEFERAWASLGNRDVTVGRFWGGGGVDLEGLYDGLAVLGLEKAQARVNADVGFLDQLGSFTSLTIFDEAHQAVAPTYRRAIDALTLRPDASLLGLTATPGRTWADIDEDTRLADLFAGRKVTLQVEGYTNPVTGLIEQGFLARPSFRTVATDAGVLLSEGDLTALADSYDLPTDLVARLTNSKQWSLQVVEVVRELVTRHRRILVFAGSVSHCRLLSAVLSSQGIDSDHVTGVTPARRRAQAIDRFHRPTSRPMVLCNYGVLTTGFDAPAASAAVVARPTRSLVLYSQMVGRVLRGPKAGGTDTCEVITVTDPDLPGFGDIAEAFENWEDVWEAAL